MPVHTSDFYLTTDLFIASMVLHFPEGHVVGIIKYVVVSDWLFFLSNTHLRFLHVFPWLDSSFFLVPDIPLSGCTTVYLTIHIMKGVITISFLSLAKIFEKFLLSISPLKHNFSFCHHYK